MKKIVVVGAGFSGLSLAYFLNQKGFSVSVYEKREKAGGLIATEKTSNGLAETAANGFLNTARVESFLQEIHADYLGSSALSKKRFVFRKSPMRWPLSFAETLPLIWKGIRFFFKSKVNRLADPRESVVGWSDRNFSSKASDYLLGPALQGIYAGDLNQLSAALVINPLITRQKKKKLSSSSLLSGKQGMGALMQDLHSLLEKKGVQFFFRQEAPLDGKYDHLVVATSAREACEVLKKINTPQALENAGLLSQIEMCSLLTATCFFKKAPKKYQGFGILFPRSEKVRALGILMNNFIFSRGQTGHSETWIFGGALDGDVLNLADSEIQIEIQNARARALEDSEEIIEVKITRWKQALPHYTIEHEKNIAQLKPMKTVTLHGNYLGQIGLSRILEKSEEIANQLAKGVL